MDPVAHPEEAVDLAKQAAFCMGVLLCVMSVLNIGQLIRYLSHSILSGFTTAAAMLIGLSQLKSAFGFSYKVPQVGSDDSVTMNYQVMQWYMQNWNSQYVNDPVHGNHFYRNHYAFQVSYHDPSKYL